jgi:DNA-binding transcriptional MerR regulator
MADQQPEGAELDIDELARRAGTTVRTVRMYQEKGLLPAPVWRGRRAAYRAEHLTRLRLVQRLADRGYSLAAIKDLVDAWDAQHGLGHLLGIEAAVTEGAAIQPGRFTADELTGMFPGDEDLSALARAVDIGLLVPDGEEFIAPNPTLVLAGAALVASGMPPHATLDLATATLAGVDRLAERFMAAFLDYVWQPFEAAGEPAAEVARMAGEIREKRALAVQAVAAAMANAMEAHIDRAIMVDAIPRAEDDDATG